MTLFSTGRLSHSGYTPLESHDKERESSTPPPRRNPSCCFRHISSILLLLSISLNVILLLHKWIPNDGAPVAPFAQLLYSPAQDVVEYRVQKFTRGLAGEVPIYEQPPSHEVDKAWQQLYIHAPSKIPASSAAQLPNKTWSVPEYEGYFLTALDVFHQLHCLDMLRQSSQPKDYPDFHISKVHLRHCIGAIRQSLMCFSDISTVSWQWNETFREGEQRDDIVHTCRNFEKIQEWADDHYYEFVPDFKNHIEWDLPV